MFQEFYTQQDDQVVVSAQQASQFAKGIAGDYNPIHTPGARRFCVPGDLLFGLVLARFGLWQKMTFRFQAMVGADVPLRFEETADHLIKVVDQGGKSYLDVTRSGDVTHDPHSIEAFVRCYVAFSGRNFPHYLKPLMEAKGVMFNPRRPLVIYDSMGFDLGCLDARAPDLELSQARLDVHVKRADALLDFSINAGGKAIGVGAKKLVVSGLCEYDPVQMEAIVDEFHRLKAAYEA